MQIDDETLMAYADGHLPLMEAKRIEAAMAQDAVLAARVARFRAVRRALRAAYDDVVKEPVPDHLRALIGDLATNEPAEPQPVQTQSSVSGPMRWWLIVLVGAGGLLIGFLVGQLA
jgi:anti-sigma factor RsiW